MSDLHMVQGVWVADQRLPGSRTCNNNDFATIVLNMFKIMIKIIILIMMKRMNHDDNDHKEEESLSRLHGHNVGCKDGDYDGGDLNDDDDDDKDEKEGLPRLHKHTSVEARRQAQHLQSGGY